MNKQNYVFERTHLTVKFTQYKIQGSGFFHWFHTANMEAAQSMSSLEERANKDRWTSTGVLSGPLTQRRLAPAAAWMDTGDIVLVK